jgi:hypothetical protein
MRENKAGAHCPLCKTPNPHTDDSTVAEIVSMFSDPDFLTLRSLEALVELHNSIRADMSERRFFAWQTRLRQIEEIYYKALYCALFADDAELPHIFSGSEPNRIMFFYGKVNEVIFEGRGIWESEPPDGVSELFKPIKILHGSAHASFFSMHIARGYTQQLIPSTYAEKLLQHINNYIIRLEYMHNMFKAGRDKQTIIDALRSMHRP